MSPESVAAKQVVMSEDSRSRYDQKLEFVLKTSAAIFAEKGFHRTSIRDISRATGMSLAGLYYYFKSKEELLFLLQDYCFGTVVDNLKQLLNGVSDPLTKLRILIENHLNFFVNNMSEMKVLSHEAWSLSGDMLKRVNARKREYVNICMEILAAIKREHELDDEIDLRVATFSLFGMMNWIYNWYNPKKDVPVNELAAQMSRIFLTGFLGNKYQIGLREGAFREPVVGRNLSLWRT